MAERGPRVRLRGPAVAALVALALGASAGCASIPDRGPVIAGRPAGQDRAISPYNVFPRGPAAGADPRKIVQGFLRAAAGFTDDHRVARTFLTPARSTTWRPGQVVLLYDRDQIQLRPTVVPGSATTDGALVDVKVPLVATVDADGRYLPRAAGSSRTLRFRTERAAGRWRIADLADGLVLSRDEFTLSFRSFPIYFPDPTGTFMVPDVHWFPLTSATSAALVSALLRGPASWLRPAVTTGAPPGTRLAVPAVPVVDDVATVDLSREARQATPRQRQLLIEQLTQTLQAYSPITQVRVTVQRAGFDAPGSDADQGQEPGQQAAAPRLQAEPRVDEAPVALDAAGRLVRLSNGRLTAIRGTEAFASSGNAAVAVAADASGFAVLDSSGRQVRYLLPGGRGRAAAVIGGNGLTRPSFDPLGWLWSAPATGSAVLVAQPAIPGQVAVAAPWLRGYQVRSLRISRDGTRALIAAVRDGRGHLLVSGVQRRTDGRPTALTEPVGLLPDLAGVLDAGWADEDQVVVLGRGRSDRPPAGTAARQVWVVQVGGPSDQVSPLAQPADTITAGNGELALVVGTPGGRLFTRAGAGWVPLPNGNAPAYPG